MTEYKSIYTTVFESLFLVCSPRLHYQYLTILLFLYINVCYYPKTVFWTNVGKIVLIYLKNKYFP